jgi:glycosyltransferase involved in cell wall biosynthesis
MRALIVTYSLPRFPSGGSAMRDYCLAREMAKSHEISFLVPEYSPKDREDAKHLKGFARVLFIERPEEKDWSFGKKLLYSVNQRVPVNRALSRASLEPQSLQKLPHLASLLTEALDRMNWVEFDLVQVEHSHLAMRLANVSCPVARVLDWHNVYSAIELRRWRRATGLFNKAGAMHELWRTRKSERRAAEMFERSIAVSEEDADVIRQLAPEAKVTVVPNGVDCSYFTNPEPGNFEHETILFTGSMDYEPNVEAVLYFTEQVLPKIRQEIMNVRFYVVGQRPPPVITSLADQFPGEIIVTGYVKDVRPYFQRAALCIVPLLNGGGTRLKVLEALAMRKPVVSTSVGAEGLRLESHRHLLLRDESQPFADAVIALLSDHRIGERLAEQGLDLVKREYDWKHIATRLDDAWQRTRLESGLA